MTEKEVQERIAQLRHEVQSRVNQGGLIEQEDVEHMVRIMIAFEWFANERGLTRATSFAQSMYINFHLLWSEELHENASLAEGIERLGKDVPTA